MYIREVKGGQAGPVSVLVFTFIELVLHLFILLY